MDLLRTLAIALCIAVAIVGIGLIFSAPRAHAVEWLGGIGATLRDQHAAPGQYSYGKATVTFNGRRVTSLTTASGRVVDYRKPSKHRK